MIKKLLKKTVKCMMILSVVLSGLMVSGLSDAYAIAVTNKNQIPVGDTVVYNGKISYSGSTVGNFSIRGMQAFCMQHPKKTPAGGTKLTNAIYENANIRKVLYYGWGGPAQWSGFNGNKAYGIVATSKVLSHYYNGDDYDSVGKNFYNFLQGKTVPDPSVNFNKSEVTAYIENGIQRTETLTLASQSNMFGVKINLDSDMTYVNESNNTRQTGGTVEIKGQTRFHFEAPLSHKGKTWASGNMTAGYQFQPIVGTPASSNLQKIGHLEGVADPMKTTSLKVNWITLQPVATVKKVTKAEANGTVVSGNDLSGVEIQVIAKNEVRNSETDEVVFEAGEVVGTYNPDSEGNLVIDDLPQFKEDESVTYIIKETKTVDGLILDDTEYELTFDIDNNSQELEIVNGMITCSFSKTGVTGEEEIEGAHLQVVDSEGTVVDEWVSGSEEHVINGLTIGETYKMVETIAPEGYAKASDVTFKVLNTTEVQHVKMVDKVVSISKVDVGGEEIEGAQMQVQDKEGTVIDEWTSSKVPHIISGLEEGVTYILKEIVAIEGYVKATDVEFTVSKDKNDQHVEMIDKIVTMSKVDVGGEEIEGAKIQVFDENNKIVDEWTSTTEPHKIKGLEEGKTYTLHEEIVAEGYVKATDVEFTVTKDKKDQHIEMVDKVVTMSKVDVGGEEVIGASMKVTDKDGKVVDEWISSDEPHKIKGLEEGESYTLHEEVATDGYVKATDIEFTVTKDKKDQHIKMVDKQVVMSKVDANGEEIEGAKIQVFDENNKIVDEWTSTTEPHNINGLEEGKTYTLHEEVTPLGFVTANDIEFTVTAEKENQYIKMIDTMVQVSKVDENGNYVKGATLQLTDETHKVIDEWVSGQHLVDISEEELAELTAGNAVRGTLESGEKYTISKNSEDYTLSIVKNNERHIYRVDGKGDETIHVLNGLVAGGEYTLREIKTPKGYSTADDIELVVNEEENMDIQMVDEITKIVLHKQDITSKKELEGAHLKVVDSEGNVVDEWISTNVPHEIRGLTVGETYTMIETIAPKGYSIAESVEFTVTDTGVEQQVVMYDALLPKKVSTGDSTAIANYILMAIASIVVFFAFKERNA